ncbi:hypothetical protein O3G_MSEX010452 [Manduca sexta]|uniref:Tudor domain-containing protein n=1 Tax=Manduca sexta TaxID=7130 RepID=A0A922CSC3_MANSE|nr:hypothetical protein O3G_MSEX010452 [Manduca sexta]
MADDLRNYKLQLQQVEAALLTDPQNEELLKLKADLEEVIELTQDLIKTQDSDSKVTNIHGSSNNDDVTASLLAGADGDVAEKYYSKWHVGEKCLAKWKADGMFYEALIEDVSDATLKVKFDGYTTLEVVSINDVKSLETSGLKRPLSGDESKLVLSLRKYKYCYLGLSGWK